MFDFGNKKLIEMLEKEIERLGQEKREFIRTVEYLTNKIEKIKNEKVELKLELKKEIEELKEQLGDVEKEVDYYKDLYENEKEYEEDVENYFIHSNNIKKLEIENIEYIELKDKIKKYTESINSSNYANYKFSYFKIENKILTPEYIKNMIRQKEIPMYCGLPFRKLQDLYKIMIFLESEKNSNYCNERRSLHFGGDNYDDIEIIKKNNFYHFFYQKILLNKKNIFDTIKDKNKIINLGNIEIKTYLQRDVLEYKNQYFDTPLKFKKILKKDCYSNVKLLNKILSL